MARRATTSEGKAGRCCQPKGLPFPGVAWDADGCLPGALIPAVEADPLRGERCPHCQRAYGGEEPAETERGSCVTAQALLQLLVAAAREQRIGRDLQAGRWVHLLAFYLGILPECGSDAELAAYCACILPRFPKASDACRSPFRRCASSGTSPGNPTALNWRTVDKPLILLAIPSAS